MKILFFIFIICFPFSVFASNETYFKPHFDNFPESKLHIQKIRDYCWYISEKMRSNSNFEIIDQGHIKTAKCFEDKYIKLYLMTASDGSKNQDELRQQFQNLRREYVTIMNDVAYVGSSFRPFFAHNYETNSVNTDYSLLVADILGDLIYKIHYRNSVTTEPKLQAAIEYLDNFTH